MKTSALLLALAVSAKVAAASPISAAFDFVIQPVRGIQLAPAVQSSECGNILECLRNEKEFSKLVQFVEKHGGKLRDDLERDGITLLAPTNEAFEYLEDALDSVRQARHRYRLQLDDLDDVETDGRRGRKGRKRHPRVAEEDVEVDDDASYGRGKGRKRRPRSADNDEDEDVDVDVEIDDTDGKGRKGRKRRPRAADDHDDEDDFETDAMKKDEMEELLRYHILDEEVSHKDLYEGFLLKTMLKLEDLDDKRQRIRVMEFNDDYYLNFHSRVDEQIHLRPKKGRILAISRVLCLPTDAMDMMAMMPFKFSTMLVAAGKTKLLDALEEEKVITIFAPDNHAWMNLGIQNLQYLFSHKGSKDLKKILEYHVVKGDVAYSNKLMEEKETCHKTLLKNEEICVCAHERGEGDHEEHRHGRKRGGNNKNRRSRAHCSAKKSLSEGHEECEPKNWVFSINDGESRITITDLLAENGVIHPISSVLIPPEIDLPHECAKDEMRLF